MHVEEEDGLWRICASSFARAFYYLLLLLLLFLFLFLLLLGVFVVLLVRRFDYLKQNRKTSRSHKHIIINMANSPEDWFKSLPPVTRTYLVLAFGTTACVSFGIIRNVMNLLLSMDLVWYKFEVWRLLTCFLFFGKFSFPFLFQMFILVRYFQSYEQNPYVTTRGALDGSTADVIFMLMFCGTLAIIIGWAFQFLILGPVIVFAVMYLWSKRNANTPISFWGFQFKGAQLPWVMLAFGILVGNSPAMDIAGIAVGHTYYFLIEVLPRTSYGKDVLSTPEWLISLCESNGIGNVAARPAAAGGAARQGGGAPRRHAWGQGRALGGGN